MQKIKYALKKILFKLVELAIIFHKKPINIQKKLLLIRIDAIGDFIIFSPMLKYYKKLYPNYPITLLVNKVNKELAERYFTDEIITFDRKKFNKNIIYRYKLLLNIRKENFDIAIYPTYSKEPWGDYLIKISDAKEKIGFDGEGKVVNKNNNKYYTRLVKPIPNIITEPERNKEFMEALGAKVDDCIPSFTPSLKDKKKATEILLKHGLIDSKFVVICLGARLESKVWALKKYSKIIDWLKKEKNIESVICGSENEKHLSEKIKVDFSNIIGETTLPVLGAILEKSVLYIGGETGIVHLASAVGTPTVCIMGGGHFNRFFPYGNLNKNKVAYHKMPCFNCNWKCKYNSIKCIENITAKQVIDQINKIIK